MQVIGDLSSEYCYIRIAPGEMLEVLNELLDLIEQDGKRYLYSEEQLLLIQSFTLAIEININKTSSIKLTQDQFNMLQEIIAIYKSLAD